MSIISSVSKVLSTREDRKVALASLVELDSDGNILYDTARAFQYYPETIDDSRGVEYITKNAIGGSHPLYQWLHGNARVISFSATFTSDEQPPEDITFSAVAQNDRTNRTATIDRFRDNRTSTLNTIKAGTGNRFNVDVAAAVAWLRSKTYPTYKNRLAKPPPQLILYLPNSGVTSGVFGSFLDSVSCLMLQCDVTYESFFRGGQPRIVTVSLSFAESIQIGSNWGYVDRTSIEQHWKDRYNLQDNVNRVGTQPPKSPNLLSAVKSIF